MAIDPTGASSQVQTNQLQSTSNRSNRRNATSRGTSNGENTRQRARAQTDSLALGTLDARGSDNAIQALAQRAGRSSRSQNVENLSSDLVSAQLQAEADAALQAQSDEGIETTSSESTENAAPAEGSSSLPKGVSITPPSDDLRSGIYITASLAGQSFTFESGSVVSVEGRHPATETGSDATDDAAPTPADTAPVDSSEE